MSLRWSCWLSQQAPSSTKASEFLQKSTLFSRGLMLEAPPTAANILQNGDDVLQFGIQPDVRHHRQFLVDFIDGSRDTFGGSLAAWIEDCVYAVPKNCIRDDVNPSSELLMSQKVVFSIRTCDKNKAEIDIPISSVSSRVDPPMGLAISPYEPELKAPSVKCVSLRTGETFISNSSALIGDESFEENRWQQRSALRFGPPMVTKRSSGCFDVAWTPARAGSFLFHILVDGQDIGNSPFEVVVIFDWLQ